jgi:ubiquitin C-terminal hydrolase
MATAMEAYIDRGDCAARWKMQPAPGLQNPDGKNLCYINSVVQLLHGMKCTRELFLMGRFWSGHDLSSGRKFAEFGEKGGFVACALQQLFNRMQFRNGRPIATALKDSLLMKSSFADFDNDLQQDATEFLGLVLSVLSELLRCNGRDPISSLFCSPVISWVRCSKCDTRRENFGDASIILHVPIIGTNIQDSLLHGFFEQERIDDWICDKQCNSHGTKGLSLETRNILVLSLKRFPNHERKDDTLVTFPLDGLDTAPFMHRSDESQTTYKLVAVINHTGNSLARGHYTLSMRFGENTWYNYDDESVKLISAPEVVTKDAYTLVYCLSNKYNDLISHE